jgi:P4 family phage/plasmid primase-like protien
VTFREDSKALHQTGIGHVFPILPGAKKPAVKGAHGIDSEKPSPAQIKRWWEQFGDANTGLAPRPPYFMLDIDQHDDKHGFDNLAERLGLSRAGLARLLYGAPRVTARSDKGHGHYYFRTPSDFDWETQTLNRYPAKDVETIRLGYYVVAPGSKHAQTGEEYRLGLYLPGRPDANTDLEIEDLTSLIPVAPPEIMALLAEDAKPRVDRGEGEIHEWIEQHDAARWDRIVEDGVLDSILARYEVALPPYDVDNHDAALRVQVDLINAAESSGEGGLGKALTWASTARDLRDPGDWERFLDRVAPPQSAPPVGVLPGIDNSARVAEYLKRKDREIEERGGFVRGRGKGWQYATSLTSQPYEFVSEYLTVNHRDESERVLLRYFGGGRWGRFDLDRGHYVVATEEEVTAELVDLLKGCTETVFNEGSSDVRPVVKTPRVVSAAVKALATKTLVSGYRGTDLRPLRGVVPFRNGLLDVETGELEPITADWNVWWNVPLDYSGPAKCPAWLAFLDSIGWGEGTEEHRLLKQWFGYVLSGSKDQQKMLLLKGPTRGGKGTILKIAAAMLGDGAVGVRLDGLAGNFGLQPLLGKSLATVGDARFENKTDKALVQTLLSLVGDDEQMVDVKNQKPVSVRLDTRVMMASNEPPKFIEASDALANRFVVLESEVSFLGREDFGLEARLREELDGIVTWSLDGLDDLREVGTFSTTERGTRFVREMVLQGSNVRRFIEDECEFGSEYKVPVRELYQAYKMWCNSTGNYAVNDYQFGLDMRTAFGSRTSARQSHGKRWRWGLRLRADV